MKCRTQTCQKPAGADCKGLCMKCYNEAKKKVEHGITSWDELADLGMIDIPKSEFEKDLERRRDANRV